MEHLPKIKNITEEFLNILGLTHGSINFEYDEDLSFWWCSLQTSRNHLFTGKNSDTLHSINYLLRRFIEKNLGEDVTKETSVLIDVNNIQKNHIDSIRTVAHMMAERARYFKSSIDVDPMNPFDRRIMHEFLSKQKDIQTESIGEGRERHIVIKYVSPQI